MDFNNFYFFVYFVVFVSIEKIYQTFVTVFYRLSKHLEFHQKCYSLRVVFSLGVWISRSNTSLVFEILLLVHSSDHIYTCIYTCFK